MGIGAAGLIVFRLSRFLGKVWADHSYQWGNRGRRHKGSLMKAGTCKLCHTPGVRLRDSHFLPRSFYALFRDGKNEPIRFSPESVYPTSKQVKDFVFCGDCEELFNRGGENWVRPLLPKVGGPFPLRDRLMKAAPLYRDEEMAVFPTLGNPEMDPGKLMHFALGVFYKAAVHSWRGASSEPYMPMEADDVEALRLYLLGKADLPKNMVVCITVDSPVSPLQSMNEPYRMADENGFNRYVFYVPGVFFQLLVGDGGEEAMPACFSVHPTRPVLVENVSIPIRNTGREQLANARHTKKLVEIMKDVDARGKSIRLGD
jgi:hypothetical protein